MIQDNKMVEGYARDITRVTILCKASSPFSWNGFRWMDDKGRMNVESMDKYAHVGVLVLNFIRGGSSSCTWSSPYFTQNEK